MRLLFAATFALGLVCAGCNEKPTARLNTPQHGDAPDNDLSGTFVYMTDNALLADMTVSDMHFYPHRAMLTTLGQQRVARLAGLLEAYGGTVRFNTDEADKELVRQRLQTILAALAEAGIDTTGEVVREDLPGGRGLRATESILIRTHEGTYKEKKASGGSGALGAGAEADSNGDSNQ